MTVLGQCSHASALYNAIVALAASHTLQKLAVLKTTRVIDVNIL